MTALLHIKWPDSRILHVCCNYGVILRELTGVTDKDGEEYFSRYNDDVNRIGSQSELPLVQRREPFVHIQKEEWDSTLRSKEISSVSDAAKSLSERLSALEMSLFHNPKSLSDEETSSPLETVPFESDNISNSDDLSPSDVVNDCLSESNVVKEERNGLIIIISIVTSCLRNVRTMRTKLAALELLTRFSQFTSDQVRLQVCDRICELLMVSI